MTSQDATKAVESYNSILEQKAQKKLDRMQRVSRERINRVTAEIYGDPMTGYMASRKLGSDGHFRAEFLEVPPAGLSEGSIARLEEFTFSFEPLPWL